ncbi:MAG TPA: AAA family ATPase, partial [Methanomassiliicoccales archaeon]|nr:AAA family ATPase [Methanomassiliicoccales archaeon]
AVQLAKENDPRTAEEMEDDLRRVEERYRKMDAADKERFDLDSLWNPYPDSRLVYGDAEREVKGVLWGIDISTGEMVLADRLREKGRTIDSVIGHHPFGLARPAFGEALHLHEYIYAQLGVPINVAEDIMAQRIREVHNLSAPANYDQAVDAARLLDMPLMCLHSVTDNLVDRFLNDLVEKESPKRVGDVVDLLLTLPEHRHAAGNNNPPEVCGGQETPGRQGGGEDDRRHLGAEGRLREAGPGRRWHGGVHAHPGGASRGGQEASPERRDRRARGLRLPGHEPARRSAGRPGRQGHPLLRIHKSQKVMQMRNPRLFKDQSKLSFDYVPDKLCHREEQLERLEMLFRPVLDGSMSQTAFLIGSVGTGKTATSKRFCLDLMKAAQEKGRPMDYIIVNCRQRSTEVAVLRRIVMHFDENFPDRGFSTEEMLRSIRKHLEKRKMHLVVVLDEADVLLVKGASDLVYQLTRFDEEVVGGRPSMSVIMISQKNVLDMLDAASSSTFRRANAIRFDKYGVRDLTDILKIRTDLAFFPGVVRQDSLDLMADIA